MRSQVETEPEIPPADEPWATQSDVRLSGISKRFGDVQALRPTDLSVARGEFFSLLGASGSGKTTTLRIIGGFEQPTTGRVFLQEKDVTDRAPYERNVNTVFQDYALFPHMTVADNIAYGLRIRRTPRSEVATRVEQALELVRLPGYGRRRPAQLSGGQRQRVALARALINRPAVLLLDEPLGALDLKLRREMQAELRRIQQDVGITFIYVTHDQEEAMSMSNRLAVMRDGRIEQIGGPAEVYEHPANAFVAGFVGVSNLVPGTVTGRDAQGYVVEVEGYGELPATSQEDQSVGCAVVVTIRPEKIKMTVMGEGSPSLPARLRGRVHDVSYAGPFTRYQVSIGSRLIDVVEQNEGAGPRIQRGEDVGLSWLPGQMAILPGTEEDLSAGQRVVDRQIE